MKALPTILASLLCAAAAVVVYDRVRGRDAVDGAPVEVVRLDALRARLDALEAGREPVLRPQGPDPRLIARLEALEARLRALEGRGGTASEGPTGTVVAQARERVVLGGAAKEPAADEVERFRKLREAAWRADRRKKLEGRVDASAKKSGVVLTARQREQVLETLDAFGARHDEIWSEVKAGAEAAGEEVDWPTLIHETRQRIQGELADRLAEHVPYADAALLSETLGSGNGK